MFARITRVALSPERLDEGAASFERDLLPQVKDLPGFVGAAVLGDRQSGRGVSVTYWTDEASMRGSEEAATKTRAQAVESGSTLIDLEHYEMVIVERAAPPRANVFVRSNESHASVDRIDDLIQFLRDKVLPAARPLKGFRAGLMGVNRANGHCLVSSIWDTAADREASEAAVSGLRSEAGQISGATRTEVERYEVLFSEMKQLVTTG